MDIVMFNICVIMKRLWGGVMWGQWALMGLYMAVIINNLLLAWECLPNKQKACKIWKPFSGSSFWASQSAHFWQLRSLWTVAKWDFLIMSKSVTSISSNRSVMLLKPNQWHEWQHLIKNLHAHTLSWLRDSCSKWQLDLHIQYIVYIGLFKTC